MQRDYWYSVARTLTKLESPESVGKIAAQRALRRLGARKVPTAKVPIVFDQLTAGSLIGEIFDAVNGDAIYRSASFLAGKLGGKFSTGRHLAFPDKTPMTNLLLTILNQAGAPTEKLGDSTGPLEV